MEIIEKLKQIFSDTNIETNIKDFVIEGTVLKKYLGNDSIIRIPDGITEISGTSGEPGPFANNENLIKVILPNSLKNIGYLAFSRCKNLQQIKIPRNVLEIGALAFEKCEKLTTIKLPNCVRKIGSYAFAECRALRKFTIPYGVKEIAMSTFSNCVNLSNLIIPNGVTKISKYAFLNCYRLTHITIPNSVRDMDLDIFDESVYRTIYCQRGSIAHQYVNYVTQLGLNRKGTLRVSLY